MDYKKYAIVDLHLHLDGSLSAKAILKVAKLEGINLPADNEDNLNKENSDGAHLDVLCSNSRHNVCLQC